MKKRDPRPICYCSAYKFPHKADSAKCRGREFITFYFYNETSLCKECNCYDEQEHSCDAAEGRESFKEAECYRERVLSYPAEKLPLSWEDIKT